MRIALYTDVHFCETSSIIQSIDGIYTTRLNYLIKSLNWAEEQAIKNNCDTIICLGDFFNKSMLNSKEITALKDIKWADLPHYCLVGNHEGSNKDIFYNTVNVLKLNGFNVVDKPSRLINFGCDILMLPYITEDTRKTLKEYWEDTNSDDFVTQEVKTKFILSHNDIKGLQYGPYTSKEGFDIEEIETSCSLFLNGHLHNGTKFCKNGFNLGNLIGQNFTEDAFNYTHSMFILDTDARSLDDIENPYAFNFYKVDINESKDLNKLYELKENAVLSLRCNETLKENLIKSLNDIKSKVIEKRIVYFKEENITKEEIEENLKTLNASDHIEKFVQCAIEKLGEDEIILTELQKLRG